MFKKPFKVRTNNAIRGSERKKLRANLSRQMPGLSDADLQLIVPTKDDMTVKKVTTHNDLQITCYCNHSNPILFETDSGRLFPTVYLLWQVQVNILSLETHPPVFSRIFGGADLLMLGVVKPEVGWPTFQTNDPCYVSLRGNCAAVAVGSTSCSSDELARDGLHDKRVKIHHCYKDFLWASGDKSDPPFIASPPPSSLMECMLDKPSVDDQEEAEEIVCTTVDDGCLENGEDVNSDDSSTERAICTEELVEEELAMDRLNIDCETTSDDHSELRNTSPDTTASSTEASTNIALDCADINQQVDSDPQAVMDTLLENCFYQALLSMKKVELPLLVSNFSSVYLHAACPTGERIDVRKSSHKKMARFLQAMQTRGVLEVRELTAGVASITAIRFECENLREFQRSEFARQAKLRKKEQSTTATSSSDDGIKIRPVYSVSAPTTPFFRLFERAKGAMMSGEEVRCCVTEYVNSNQLASTNKKQVQLDALLTDVLVSKGERVEVLPWNEVMKRMCNTMNECHEISLPGLPPVIRKGNPQNIQISVEQRMGNKKVTLIENLELFGIDVKAFAHHLQQAAASSTTVNSYGKAQERMQVQAQGNQLKHANKLLEQLHIPSRYVSEKGEGGGGKAKTNKPKR